MNQNNNNQQFNQYNSNNGQYSPQMGYTDFSRQSFLSDAFTKVMSQVYLYMFYGLLCTGLAAYLVSSSTAMQEMIFGNPPVFYGLLISELILVMAINPVLKKSKSYMLGFVLFTIYAIINGLTFSVLFMVYEIGSVATAFFMTCMIFGCMSVIGYVTKKDLTSIGMLCFVGLIGVVIASLVNFFLQNEMMDYIVSIIAIVVFIGLTAYDTQKIKRLMANCNSENEIGKVAVYGALNLYLDFINIFIYILRIMGKKK